MRHEQLLHEISTGAQGLYRTGHAPDIQLVAGLFQGGCAGEGDRRGNFGDRAYWQEMI